MLFVCLFARWCLMPPSTIFHLYRGGQFYWWRKPENPSHNVVRLALIEIQTHNISGDKTLIVEVVVNPTTIRLRP
jgi:hypothetical protein